MTRSFDEFKSGINLVAFAASYGYALDKQESSRGSAVLRHPDSDKIIVSRAQSGHWIYFSVRDKSDSGTIIDFVQRRKRGASLGHVRRELATWSGSGPTPTFDAPEIVPASKDRTAIARNWAAMEEVCDHPYLESRGLRRGLLSSSEFAGSVRIDSRGNAVFGHRDQDGVCGYEIKNRGFTGFATGGAKSLWLSNTPNAPEFLVVSESAIDALSHAALKPNSSAIYASTAGGWSDTTRQMLRGVAASLPTMGRVVLAFDADEQGRRYAADACELLADLGRNIIMDLPPIDDADWNDVLRSQPLFDGSAVPSLRGTESFPAPLPRDASRE